MTSIFLLLTLIFSSYAAVETVVIKGAQVDYTAPEGSGRVEKIFINYGQNQKYLSDRQSIAIFRHADSMELTTPFLTFEWLRPWPFVHDLKYFKAQEVEVGLKKEGNLASAGELSLVTDQDKTFSIKGLRFDCLGESHHSKIGQRVLASCLKSTQGKIREFILPQNFLDDMAQDMSTIPDDDRPVDDFSISILDGELFMHLKIKYLIDATVRLWGHIQLDEKGKVMSLRVDEIKYGILPVTYLVLNELKKRVNHPDLEINPPWIRLRMN